MVLEYHYYTGQNRYNLHQKCVKPVGTIPLKPPKTTGLLSERIHFQVGCVKMVAVLL